MSMHFNLCCTSVVYQLSLLYISAKLWQSLCFSLVLSGIFCPARTPPKRREPFPAPLVDGEFLYTLYWGLFVCICVYDGAPIFPNSYKIFCIYFRKFPGEAPLSRRNHYYIAWPSMSLKHINSNPNPSLAWKRILKLSDVMLLLLHLSVQLKAPNVSCTVTPTAPAQPVSVSRHVVTTSKLEPKLAVNPSIEPLGLIFGDILQVSAAFCFWVTFQFLHIQVLCFVSWLCMSLCKWAWTKWKHQCHSRWRGIGSDQKRA